MDRDSRLQISKLDAIQMKSLICHTEFRNLIFKVLDGNLEIKASLGLIFQG